MGKICENKLIFLSPFSLQGHKPKKTKLWPWDLVHSFYQRLVSAIFIVKDKTFFFFCCLYMMKFFFSKTFTWNKLPKNILRCLVNTYMCRRYQGLWAHNPKIIFYPRPTAVLREVLCKQLTGFIFRILSINLLHYLPSQANCFIIVKSISDSKACDRAIEGFEESETTS